MKNAAERILRSALSKTVDYKEKQLLAKGELAACALSRLKRLRTRGVITIWTVYSFLFLQFALIIVSRLVEHTPVNPMPVLVACLCTVTTLLLGYSSYRAILLKFEMIIVAWLVSEDRTEEDPQSEAMHELEKQVALTS